MAQEATLNCSVVYEDSRGVIREVGVTNRKVSITTRRPSLIVQSVGITEEAVDLGDVGTPCIAFFRNLDPTNYVQIRSATGLTADKRLRPDTDQDGTGGFACYEIDPASPAPFIIANTAACEVEIFLLPT